MPASRLALVSNWRYVSLSSPYTSATADGSRRTCSANRSWTRYMSVAPGQAGRADVGPVGLHVCQGILARACGQHGAPAARHVDLRWPQRVLLLVVDEHQKAPILVVERIGRHGNSRDLIVVRISAGHVALSRSGRSTSISRTERR